MELGNFQKPVESDEIRKMASDITGESVKAVFRICEQWGEAEDEVREYDVYVIETDAGKYTLKKTGSKEAQIYAQLSLIHISAARRPMQDRTAGTMAVMRAIRVPEVRNC